MTIDLLLTIAHLIGADLLKHKIDGKNIWPLIAGEPNAKSPHERLLPLLWKRVAGQCTERWKLHLPHASGIT